MRISEKRRATRLPCRAAGPSVMPLASRALTPCKTLTYIQNCVFHHIHTLCGGVLATFEL